jgi:FAD/FMN-containing dehydrogenase
MIDAGLAARLGKALPARSAGRGRIPRRAHRGLDAPATAARAAGERVVYAPLEQAGGAISAEHGIGLEKKDWLPISRSPAEIALMRTLKSTMDPKGILNPGRVF